MYESGNSLSKFRQVGCSYELYLQPKYCLQPEILIVVTNVVSKDSVLLNVCGYNVVLFYVFFVVLDVRRLGVFGVFVVFLENADVLNVLVDSSLVRLEIPLVFLCTGIYRYLLFFSSTIVL